MPRSTRISLLILGSFVMLLAIPAAGAVAPKKPSDLVSARGTPDSPLCPGDVGRHVDTQQNPDGTTSPFAIPAGSIFVVTSLEWLSPNTPPGTLAGVDLFIVDTSGTSISFLSHARAVAPTTGNGGGGTVATPAGIVVKSGSNLCFEGTGGGSTVIVRGFLAKDR
jgi:hypothetical protein